MKKLLGVFLVGILTALPMVAGANKELNPVTDVDPGATTPSAQAASATPKYALKNSAGTDTNVATAGYVKGAYNAAIKGVNALQGEIDQINSDLEDLAGDLSDVQTSLTNDYATKTGVAATVNSATTSGSFTGATVSGNFTNAAISGTVSGNASGTIPAMTTWGSDTPGTADATATLSNATVSGNASGSVTGTASGTTTGNVSVDGYHAS